MMRLYGNHLSANCYKPRLLLHQLEVVYDYVEIDILKGEARSEAFRRRNVEGRVPVLELADGRCLPESNAILMYLAAGTAMLPAGRWEQAEVLRWLFFEQNAHEPNIATSRFLLKLSGRAAEMQDQVAMRRPRGLEALLAMETHLKAHAWFAADRYTIADIALYGYTRLAPEGGFELEPYPCLCQWLEQVEEQPRFVGMSAPQSP